VSSSDDLFARATAVMPGGNTRTTLFVAPHPPYAARGQGARLWDVDGHETLDLQANYASLVHGHRHPVVLAAMADALVDGVSFGLPTRADVELAEHLTARVPAMERLRFTSSGTEAVMMAIRTARAATGRDGVLRFAGSYHGTYDAALAGDAAGMTRGVRGDLVTVPVGDAGALRTALAAHGHRLACVIVDLMPNRAGLVPLEPAFVELLRSETAARGVLLVIDEIITFRLEHGGLMARYGVVPDLVCLGKIIGGGLPVGAFGGRAEVMDVLDPRGARPVAHGGTFSGNPVTTRKPVGDRFYLVHNAP